MSVKSMSAPSRARGLLRVPAQPARPGDGEEPTVTLLPARLDTAALADAVRSRRRVLLDEAAAEQMECSRKGLQQVLDRGESVYGATTGFGPHVRYAADPDTEAQGSGLIAHLASGTGPYLAPTVVRATVLVRANSLSRGHSAVRPDVVRALLDMIDAGVVPAVPSTGSVGASGDLVPLAHVARCLTGEGRVLDLPADDVDGEEQGDLSASSRTRPAAQVLREHGLAPVRLDARDALALVNGTALSTALAALAAARARLLLERTLDTVGWLYAALGAQPQALDPRLHAVRGQQPQAGAAESISRVARALSGSSATPWSPAAAAHAGRPLQEVYSLRCAPQVLGPALALVDFATATVDAELGGTSDNPVLVQQGGRWEALHGGNFHAAASATASDLLSGALTQAAVLLERQVDVLANPATSHAPLLLARFPGRQAGLAGAQLTASALVAEMRHACQWASTMSIPTNAGNQDIVPMAPLAGRTALAQGLRLAGVLSVLALMVRQQQHLVAEGVARGCLVDAPSWLPVIAGHDLDHETHLEIGAVTAAVLNAPIKEVT